MPSGAILTGSAKRSTNSGVAADFKPRLPLKRRTRRELSLSSPAIERSASLRLVSAVPGAGKLLLLPTVAKTLQTVYHLFNTKAHKYEPLASNERLKWETYYATDQKELSDWPQGLQVVD